MVGDLFGSNRVKPRKKNHPSEYFFRQKPHFSHSHFRTGRVSLASFDDCGDFE